MWGIHQAVAQESVPDSLMESHSLEEVEVIGSAPTQALDALDHQMIHKETLLRIQGNTLMQSLEILPGISSIQTGTGISKPVIRGMSVNRVVVNEYGIKQENQQWGLDHGLEIDQYNIEQVEIIKGPVSLLYGSDGIGGVIQIHPSKPPQTDTSCGDIVLNYKSNNNLFGGSGKWVLSRDKWYLMARMSYQDYGLYRIPTDSFTYNGYRLPIYNGRLKNTGGNEWSNSIYLGYRTEKWSSNLYLSNVRQKAGFFPGAFGIPRLYQLQPAEDPRALELPFQYINHFKAISNTQVFTSWGILKLDIGYQWNTRKEISAPHAHGNGVVPQGTTALLLNLHTFQSNLRWEYQSPQWRVQSGISLQYQNNQIGGFEFLIPAYRQLQSGMFVYSQYNTPGSGSFNAGIRYDMAHQSADEGTVIIYDSTGEMIRDQNRSPEWHKSYHNLSGALGWKKDIDHNWILSANLGTAFRVPMINELLANGVHHGSFRHEMGDTSLLPEKGWMVDVGIDYHNHTWHASLTPFINYFSNYIYLHPSGRFSTLPEAGQIYQYKNTSALYWGAEFLIDYPVWRQFFPDPFSGICL
ncbi:MAG: TonB-dependent receptor [Taibaiella sp.]|nr:TonB-dependent receptor [Taibaiella sp.]